MMDAITAAVALLDQQTAIQKLDVAAKLVRNNEETKQGLIDLITASASSSGTLYTSGGGASVPSSADVLNVTA